MYSRVQKGNKVEAYDNELQIKELKEQNSLLSMELKQSKENIKILQCQYSIIKSHKEMLEKSTQDFNSIESSLSQKLDAAMKNSKKREEELERISRRLKETEFREKITKVELTKIKTKYTKDTQRFLTEKQQLIEDAKKLNEELMKTQSDAAALRLMINETNKGNKDQLIESERTNRQLKSQLEYLTVQ